jgi:hypothetical protein
MRVLIGYSMRSGSTVLAHVLGGHSRVRAYGDLSSVLAMPGLARPSEDRTLIVKPPDLVFLGRRFDPRRFFDRGIWLARDPRDSYLSALDSGYAYLCRRPGPFKQGIDTGFLERWRRVHAHYFECPSRWHLLRYEDLARQPSARLAELQTHLDLPVETLLPFRFRRRDLLNGGDYKVARTRNLRPDGIGRHRRVLTAAQQSVFRHHLGEEMSRLGYPAAADAGDAALTARRTVA